VLDATKGRGASLILESVGGDVFQACLRCWAVRGRLVLYGKASGKPGFVAGDDLLYGHRTVSDLAPGMVIDDTTLLRSSMAKLFDWQTAGSASSSVGSSRWPRPAPPIGGWRASSRRERSFCCLDVPLPEPAEAD
jgi:NADPH:quinone reductase